MIQLLQSNWRFDISTQAANNLSTQKLHKTTIVPLASDLKLLKNYLLLKENKAVARLNLNDKDEFAYTQLLETAFCCVLLLNRKRSGELQKLPLHLYEKCEADDTQNYEEFGHAISLSEKNLMERFKRIVTRGKRGRGVPILFSPDVQEHLKIILRCRHNFLLNKMCTYLESLTAKLLYMGIKYFPNMLQNVKLKILRQLETTFGYIIASI